MDNLPRSVLYEEAEKLGLNPQKISSDGLFTVTYKEKTAYVYTFTSLNTQLGGALAKNKYITRVIAERASIPNIPYLFTDSNEELESFLETHKKIIKKPLYGKNAVGVEIITSQNELHQKIAAIRLKEYLFEKYCEGTEYRYLIVNNKLIAVNKKTLTPTPEDQWKKNVNIVTEDRWDPTLIKQAESLSYAINLKMCAVDFIVDSEHNGWLLEVNSQLTLVGFYSADEKYGEKLAQRILISILREQLGDDFCLPFNGIK